MNDMIIGTAGTKLLESFAIFKVGKIMVSKYRCLMMLPGAFLDIESYLWYWFYRWSNSSVLCSSFKKTFVDAGNLQVTTNKFLRENLQGLMYCIWTQFCVYIVLVS